jgi:hypothetical protein
VNGARTAGVVFALLGVLILLDAAGAFDVSAAVVAALLALGLGAALVVRARS